MTQIPTLPSETRPYLAVLRRVFLSGSANAGLAVLVKGIRGASALVARRHDDSLHAPNGFPLGGKLLFWRQDWLGAGRAACVVLLTGG